MLYCTLWCYLYFGPHIKNLGYFYMVMISKDAIGTIHLDSSTNWSVYRHTGYYAKTMILDTIMHTLVLLEYLYAIVTIIAELFSIRMSFVACLGMFMASWVEFTWLHHMTIVSIFIRVIVLVFALRLHFEGLCFQVHFHHICGNEWVKQTQISPFLHENFIV